MRVLLVTIMLLCRPCIPTHQIHEDNVDMVSLNELGLTSDDIATMFRTRNAMDKPLHKTDCFLQVANAIRARCRQDHMSEDERIHAAISMTLCELATANYQSPPLECVPFSLDGQAAEMFVAHRSQRGCVEALSRSAQFWSSYSGYLREIPQLCFVFGRWNDIDIARDAYKNATLEKIVFLRHISEREISLQAQISTWANSISELQSIVSSMGTLSQEVSLLTEGLEHKLQYELSEIVSVHAKAVEEYLFERGAKDAEHFLQINTSLSQLHEHHANELRMIVPYLRTTLQEQLGPVFSGVRVVHDLLITFQSELHKEWLDILGQLEVMHRFLSELQHGINSSSAAVRSLDHDLVMLHGRQVRTAEAAENLHNAVLSITASAFLEMQKINNTMHSIGSAVELSSHRSYWPVVEDFVYRIVSYICRGYCIVLSSKFIMMSFETVDMQKLDQIRYSQVSQFMLEITFSIVRTFLSAIASLLVLVYSSRKYLRRWRLFGCSVDELAAPKLSPSRRQDITAQQHQTRKPVSRIPDRLYRQ
ncbi:hypothetical protein APHAL10511_002512 [Amanita phalloides]|nr:hypothetical protein APHAL10511_002512 [Amanita phalloides]